MAAGLVAVLVSVAGAQNQRAGEQFGKAGVGRAPERAAAVTTNNATVTPTGSTALRQVLAAEYTVLPGTTAYFEWATDLSGAEKVGISITTLSDPRSTLTNLRFGVAFAAPGDWYIVSDVFFGSDFFYNDHGAFTTRVYGPLMKVSVSNDGDTAVRITRLVANAVVH
jgi:hypothetical protein